MCAILDTNVKHELEAEQGQAGAFFCDWLLTRGGKIVIGGTKLRNELYANPGSSYSRLFEELRRAGAVIERDDSVVDSKADDLHHEGVCVSDDYHIIALAQNSGARLLYTNDRRLQTDFKNKSLIDKPRGKVYTTNETKIITSAQKKLLKDRNLCRIMRS